MLYAPDEEFPIGGSRVVRSSDADEVTLVGCGITVHEALKAADALAGDGIAARVVDCYSIKPIDGATLAACAEATGRIVTVEDHWPEGGLGEAVLSALAEQGAHAKVARLAVREMPRSGQARRAARRVRDRRRRDRKSRARADLACTAAWPS